MGTRLVAKGVYAESYATEYAPPVRRGLQGIFFMNGSLTKAQRNYAPGKSNLSLTPVGAPVVSANYASLKGMQNFFDTPFVETPAMTLIVVARSFDTQAANANRPIFIGNFAGTGPANLGSSLFNSGAASSQMLAARSDGAGGVVNGAASLNPAVLTDWTILIGVVPESAPNKIFNLTANTTGVGTISATRVPTTNRLRIGSGYSTYEGTSDIAAVGVYSIAMTDDEVYATAADLRRYMARRGIVV